MDARFAKLHFHSGASPLLLTAFALRGTSNRKDTEASAAAGMFSNHKRKREVAAVPELRPLPRPEVLEGLEADRPRPSR